jgi:hypothetical protein
MAYVCHAVMLLCCLDVMFRTVISTWMDQGTLFKESTSVSLLVISWSSQTALHCRRASRPTLNIRQPERKCRRTERSPGSCHLISLPHILNTEPPLLLYPLIQVSSKIVKPIIKRAISRRENSLKGTRRAIITAREYLRRADRTQRACKTSSLPWMNEIKDQNKRVGERRPGVS